MTTAREALADLVSVVYVLADQQAMQDDFWREPVARARAALAAHEAAPEGWQPIETHTPPHDVPVLLYSANGEIEARPYSRGPVGSRSLHGWATHWMPLPTPPLASKEKP